MTAHAHSHAAALASAVRKPASWVRAGRTGAPVQLNRGVASIAGPVRARSGKWRCEHRKIPAQEGRVGLGLGSTVPKLLGSRGEHSDDSGRQAQGDSRLHFSRW